MPKTNLLNVAAAKAKEAIEEVVEEVKEEKTVEELAKEVIRGDWGNGDERKKRLREAGYDPAVIQAKVNEILHK